MERKEEDSLCWFDADPLKLRGFRYFYDVGEGEEGEGKEEVLKSMMAAGFTFFDIWKMLGDSMFLWEWMREIEGKQEDSIILIWHFTIKSEDLLLFWGRIWGGERKEEVMVWN